MHTGQPRIESIQTYGRQHDRTDTMNLIKWIKDKYQKRRDERDEHDPWWVTFMLDVGRPAVAILILTMCAPGEHFLAAQSGLNDRLAWGMPGTLTAYAGIAAVVATKRPKDAPGHRTAVSGAIVAVLLAMAAQPVAHLYGRFGEPTREQQIGLIIIVGMIPAAVFGHLLHMGAAVSNSRRTVRTDRRRTPDRKPDRKPDSVRPPVVTAMDSVPDTSAAGVTDTTDTVPDTAVTPAAGVRRTADGSMRTVARDYMANNRTATDEEVSAHLLSRFGQDSKPNSVYVSVKRARRDLEQTG